MNLDWKEIAHSLVYPTLDGRWNVRSFFWWAVVWSVLSTFWHLIIDGLQWYHLLVSSAFVYFLYRLYHTQIEDKQGWVLVLSMTVWWFVLW